MQSDYPESFSLFQCRLKAVYRKVCLYQPPIGKEFIYQWIKLSLHFHKIGELQNWKRCQGQTQVLGQTLQCAGSQLIFQRWLVARLFLKAYRHAKHTITLGRLSHSCTNLTTGSFSLYLNSIQVGSPYSPHSSPFLWPWKIVLNHCSYSFLLCT